MALLGLSYVQEWWWFATVIWTALAAAPPLASYYKKGTGEFHGGIGRLLLGRSFLE